MKFCLFNGFGYPPKEKTAAWPVPSRLHVQENVAAAIERALGNFEFADRLGFDWIGTPEHHFKAYLSTDAVLTGALLARLKLRAKIALLGVIVPGRDPLVLAENLASLDQFTGGNFAVALLRGNPYEAITLGVNPAERNDIFEESVEFMLRAWLEGEPFGWEGLHLRKRAVSVWPKPVNSRRPETIVSVSNVRGASFAARLGLSIGLAHIEPARAAELVGIYREEAERHGWHPEPENILYHCEIHAAASDAEASRQIAEYRLGILPDPLGAQTDKGARLRKALLEEDKPHFADGFNVLRFSGGPQALIDQIDAVSRQVGFGVVNLIFQGMRLPGSLGRESIELFASDVMPRLRG